MKRLALFLLLSVSQAFGTTVSGTIKDVTGTAITKNAYVNFTLRNYSSNQPRVIGSHVIGAPSAPFYPNASGVISGTITGNDLISPGPGVPTTYYDVCTYFGSQQFRCAAYSIVGSTFNLNSATPITTVPVVAPPTGDLTYLRTDLGNQASLSSGPLTVPGIVHFAKGPEIDVVAYGADPTNTIDSTASIQAAINYAQTHGGTVYLPPGAGYKIATGPLVITAPIMLQGHSADLGQISTLNSTSTTADIIQVNQGAQGTKIRDIAFKVTGTATAGAAININLTASVDGSGASPAEVIDCVINNTFNGVLVRNGNQIVIDRLFTAVVRNDGIKITGGLQVQILQSNLLGSLNDGIEVTGVGGLTMTDVQATNGVHSLVMSGGAQVFAKGFVGDTPSGDCMIISTVGGQIEFVDSWCSGSTGGYGINLSNTTGFSWLGGWIRANKLSGVNLQATATKVSIANARISDNGHNGTVQNGVLVQVGASYFQIQNNQIGKDNGDAPAEQTVGVRVLAGGSDYYMIQGNLNSDPANQTLVVDGGTGIHKSVANNVN